MEISERKKPRLFMKFTDSRQDESPAGAMVRTPDHRTVYRPPRPRPRALRKGGATGFGFRLNVTVCPRFDQISLAFSTLLLILSLDFVVLSALKSLPGIFSSRFTATQCIVAEKTTANMTHCYVSSLDYHRGTRRLYPCLQIYVRLASDNTSHVPWLESSGSVTEATAPSNTDQNLLLLYQNELHLAGGDYLHTPCSFLPNYCSYDAQVMHRQVDDYSDAVGPVNSTIACHYLANPTGLDIATNGVAIKLRAVTAGQVANMIIWPVVGVIVSVACCVLFWKKNYHRSRRLFIYNAWSPS